MSKKTKPTFQKRNREIARLEKRKAKEARRLEAKERRAEARPGIGDEDPDIVGIDLALSRHRSSAMILAMMNKS